MQYYCSFHICVTQASGLINRRDTTFGIKGDYLWLCWEHWCDTVRTVRWREKRKTQTKIYYIEYNIICILDSSLKILLLLKPYEHVEMLVEKMQTNMSLEGRVGTIL
jgi:hypothetical protein